MAIVSRYEPKTRRRASRDFADGGILFDRADFGPFSGALLVANNIPKGRINAFDPNTGTFLGVLRDMTGQAIEIDQLWAIQFGNTGNNGAPNQLFFCSRKAGPESPKS